MFSGMFHLSQVMLKQPKPERVITGGGGGGGGTPGEKGRGNFRGGRGGGGGGGGVPLSNRLMVIYCWIRLHFLTGLPGMTLQIFGILEIRKFWI